MYRSHDLCCTIESNVSKNKDWLKSSKGSFINYIRMLREEGGSLKSLHDLTGEEVWTILT